MIQLLCGTVVDGGEGRRNKTNGRWAWGEKVAAGGQKWQNYDRFAKTCVFPEISALSDDAFS